MAVRNNQSGDAWVNAELSEGLEAAVLDKVHYLNYIGASSSSVVQKKDELIREAGEQLTVTLRYQDTAAPLGESDTFETNERAILTASDSFVIGELGTPYRWKTKMSRQRVKYEDREEAMAAISDNLANALDQGLMNQLAGYNATSGTTYGSTMNGLNTVEPLDSAHHVLGGSGNSNDEDLSTDGSDKFTLDLVSKAVYLAKASVEPRIRPAQIPGLGEKYIVFIHPNQLWQLREQDSRWDKVQMAFLQGGFIDRNPLLTGAAGVWDDALLVESNRVPTGVNSSSGAEVTTARRAILCGAQAAVIGWGRVGGSPGSFVWEEERFDFGRERAIAGSCLVGIKALGFQKPGNAAVSRFATIVISTDSQAPA